MRSFGDAPDLEKSLERHEVWASVKRDWNIDTWIGRGRTDAAPRSGSARACLDRDAAILWRD